MDAFLDHLLSRLAEVQEHLGVEPATPLSATARFADALDSMGMVEFLLLVAQDCGVKPTVIEECVGRTFRTVGDLAEAMSAAGLSRATVAATSVALSPGTESPELAPAPAASAAATLWLAATAAHLPEQVQSGAAINALLDRPAGWIESHAGIRERRVWADQDPLAAAVAAAHDCLTRAGLELEEVGAMLVTSEAPPLLAGLAAAVHHRLDLPPRAVALEVGGACTGFLAALWTARALVPQVGAVLVLSVECPSHWLPLHPGPAGEAAALFGDGTAACLLSDRATGTDPVPFADVVLGVDGGNARLIRIERPATGGVELQLEGGPLADRAVRTMTQAVRDLAGEHGLSLSQLQGVVAHGGNGRLPALLARQLGLPRERVWSEAEHTGNLGSASLPVAWAAHPPATRGPVIWTAVGAGLTWGAALLGCPPGPNDFIG